MNSAIAIAATLALLLLWGAAIYLTGPREARGSVMGDEKKGDGFSLNIGNMFGGQAAKTIYNYEDRSPRARMRALFSSFEPRANRLTGKHVVRMEPHHLEDLQQLISEAGEDSPLSIESIVGQYSKCALNNGLGPNYACDMQYAVALTFKSPLQ